ncbi:MAG: HEAT repeat domain-containing protein, partial [Verrucomicrobiota bacterium]
MTSTQLALGILSIALWTSPSADAAETIDAQLGEASWIWHRSGGSLCYFRRSVVLTEEVRAAQVAITADNGYELFVNGAFVASDIGIESGVWQSVETHAIASMLRIGTNVIAIRALDLGGQAGFLAAVRIEISSRPAIEWVTDSSWKVAAVTDPTGFAQADFKEDAAWESAKMIGANGAAPWGWLKTGGVRSPNHPGKAPGASGFKDPPVDFQYPERLIFLRGRIPESSTPGAPQAVWRIGNSRAYLELDTLGPSMPGRIISSLQRTRGKDSGRQTNQPSYQEEVLLDAGAGLVGSPALSHDGKILFFSRVVPGEKFWRIARLDLTLPNAVPTLISDGSFHDFDPEPLPDGRVVFSSTRIGNREEYHGNFARSLFVMDGDGSNIRAITHHIVGDMEPKLTATGNIVFVRQDNFLERAKVETHLHIVRPDGTSGHVLLGADRDALSYHAPAAAEENGLWLRSFGFGSPAPLPDGRVAALSSAGLVISGNEILPRQTFRPAMELIDISPLPDGRLLCTLAGHSGVGVFDPDRNEIVRIYADAFLDLHSVIHAGPRAAPAIARSSVDPALENTARPTGFLLGQNVFLTRQKHADRARIKAIRIIEGRPFAVRSARHPYDHLGVEAIELGTVPVAADGSFYVEVPADRALSIQAVDGEGRSVINELSWIYVRPGEQRSCVGCHSQREAAPSNHSTLLALRAPPVKLLGRGQPHRWRGNNAANGGVLNLQFDRMREAGSINLHEQHIPEMAGEPSHQVWIRRLADPSPATRISAAQRLALLREHAAASALSRVLLSDESAEARLAAALALGGCGTRESVPALLKALRDNSPAVAQATFVALQTLTGDRSLFNAFASPLEKSITIDSLSGSYAGSGLDEQSHALMRLMGSSASEASMEEVFNALGHIGTMESAMAVLEFVQRDRGNDLRASLAAIRALGQMRCAEAVPILSEVLLESAKLGTNLPPGDHEFGWTQTAVQRAASAAEALGRIGTPDAGRALLDAFTALEPFWHYTFRAADHDWLMGCHSSPVHFRILEGLDRIAMGGAARIAPAILRSIPIDPDRALLMENDAYETLASRILNRAGVR